MNLKKLERYLRVNLLGPGPRLIKKEFTRAAVSQKLRNTNLSRVYPTRGPRGCIMCPAATFLNSVYTINITQYCSTSLTVVSTCGP